MSDAATNNLSKTKIQQLLAAVGAAPAEDSGQNINASEYDWRQPHCFSQNQLEELNNFTEKVATAISNKFTDFYHADFNITIASTDQYFVDKFLAQTSDDKQDDYYLAFGAVQDNPFGLIGIPAQTAIIWATQLLGDTESEENPERELSKLEESLLLDIASALVKVLSDSCDNYDFQPVDNIVKGQLPLELDNAAEVCKITFNIEEAGSEKKSEAYILMPSSKLEPVVGQNIQDDNEFSAENTSEALLGHVQQMPVSVTAQLASTVVTFEEIMSLGVDDILLLDKKVDEPVELIVDGRASLGGRLAKSAGKYAVVITELCDTK